MSDNSIVRKSDMDEIKMHIRMDCTLMVTRFADGKYMISNPYLSAVFKDENCSIRFSDGTKCNSKDFSVEKINSLLEIKQSA